MKLLDKIKTEIQNLRLMALSLFSSTKDKVEIDVPYVSQFAHPEYAERILKDGVEKTTDPNWKSTGAETAEEYADWVLTMCGMACTSMALKHFNGRDDGIVSLAKDAMRHRVYKQEGDELSSMHYKEFVEWLRDYGLRAEIYTRLGIHGLQKLLSDGKLIIVSVNPNIREDQADSTTQRGGHLVLVTGYDKQVNTLTLHNPSGFVSQNTQENHRVLVSKFLKYYAGRGIALASE